MKPGNLHMQGAKSGGVNRKMRTSTNPKPPAPRRRLFLRKERYMFELEAWLSEWRAAVMGSFAGRVRFLGIQGSRARGEARDESDIDAVLVLDKLAPGDVFAYRSAVAGLAGRRALAVLPRHRASVWLARSHCRAAYRERRAGERAHRRRRRLSRLHT